jgi:hypothetical protein
MRHAKAAFLAAVLVLGFALLVTGAGEAKSPFETCHQMRGELSQLAVGDKIKVVEYVTPLCAQCFLFHRENKKPYGPDVEVEYRYVFFPDRGKSPVRLMLLTKLAAPELEAKMLETLFDASFVKKVPVEDEEVLGAIAAANGLGDQWNDPAWQKKVDVEMEKLKADFATLGGPPKTPTIVFGGVVATSPGICGVQGDEMPAKVHGLLDEVRAWRAKN